MNNLRPPGSVAPTRLAAILFGMAMATSLSSATLEVTSTNDAGDGSLRQAILSANLTDVSDLIQFNIAGAGPHTIAPLTPLPALTSPVFLDGYSQPGASMNTLSTGDNAVVKILVRDKLTIDTTNSTVRGLAVSQIQVGAIPGPKGSNVIEGCFVGLDPTGTNALGGSPGFGIFLQTPNNRVGGPNAAARNLISGKGTVGLEIFEVFGSNNVVQGNYIGTDRTGTKAIGNAERALAVNMNASANFIGGEATGAGNVISGNLDRGITLDGSHNFVLGNRIGTTPTGQPLGNARTGVEIGGIDNNVGGRRPGAGNIIAFNGRNGGGLYTTNGIDVKPGAMFFGIMGNSIFENAGLGIDLKADGLITPGFPVLTLVSNTSTSTVIKGTFMPNAGFLLELFANPIADPSNYGEGKTVIYSGAASTDASGVFTVTLPSPLAPGLFVTATANANTEFSQGRMVSVVVGPNSWTKSDSGKWEEGTNWSLQVPPFSGHVPVSITNGSTKTVRSDALTVSGSSTTLTISNLVVSAPDGSTNTLLLRHGDTATPLDVLKHLTVGPGGEVVIDNAALRVGGTPGTAADIDGSLTLRDGSFTVTNNSVQTYIGHHGLGTLTVSNGTFLSYYPIVGAREGGNGLWRIAGGSNIVLTTFDLGDSLSATGSVEMTGGVLTTPSAYIGLFGNGRMVVSNGIFQCAAQLLIGSQTGSQGTFIAAGGVSSFGRIQITEPPYATGAVVVAGTALVNVDGELDNRGTVTVAGGKLTIGGPLESFPDSVLVVTGGELVVTNDTSYLTQVIVSNGTFLARDVYLGNDRVGNLILAGGVIACPGASNGFNVGVNGGTGTVWQAGGQINLANTDLNVGGLFTPAVGQMIVSNGLTHARNVFVGGQGGGNGELTMAGGRLISSNLFVNPASRMIFRQGLVQTRSAAVSNTAPFVVGDDTNVADLQLLGGTNSFRAGLNIARNSRLTGSGSIVANVTNSGVIAPGVAAGSFNIKGNLVLSNNSELRLDLVGHNPTEFDLIHVSGNARLGGKLLISLSNNFARVMTNGASFTVLDAGAPLAGTFNNVFSGGPLTTTDGYARFTVIFAGETAVRLTDLVIVDTDGDGLPDWWEDQNNLNKNDPADALADLDGDGASNADEFRAGTLPNNASSVFRVIAFQRESSDMRIAWTTVGGKTYRVQTSAPTAGGSYTNQFINVSSLISVGGVGESTTNFLHAGGFDNSLGRYYRIALEP